MNYDIVLTFVLSSLALTISPGPDILFVISQSFNKGKKQAIMTSLGLTTGLFFHTFLLIIGFSLLIKENQNLFFVLKFLGASYLIFLAFNTIQFAILGILFWIQATFVFVTVYLFASSLKALVYKDSLFAKNLFWLEIFVYIFISIWIFI